VLKAHFFPRIPTADLFNIPSFIYPSGKVSSANITVGEIASILPKAKFYKVPGPDSIPVFVHKLLGRPLLEYLQVLSQALFAFSYHPSHLRRSSIIAMKKPGKEECSVPAT
jgi:hypothetical protein